MNIQRITTVLLLLTLLFSGIQTSAQAADPLLPADYEIPNGHFFTQAVNGEGGFRVINDGDARFWSEFQRLGGLQMVGYPISQRFEYDGFVTQAFQKLVLQWRPEAGQAWPINMFDELSKQGFNDTLLYTYQTPQIINSSQFDAPNASWQEVVYGRERLLDANDAIRTRYFSVSDPLSVFGLPTSYVTDMGSHYALRTQRAVFQQWVEDVPWATRGEVTIANGGDIAKELGWLSSPVLIAEARPAASDDNRNNNQAIASVAANNNDQPTPIPRSETLNSSDNQPATTVRPQLPALLGKPWQLRTLLMGPGTPGRLYALQLSQDLDVEYRLMISDDYGDSWSRFHGDIPDATSNIDIDYQKPDGLYANTANGLYQWTGSQWRRLSGERIFDLAVPYGNPSAIWAINLDRVLLQSADWGSSWRTVVENKNFLTLALDPRDNSTLYSTALNIGHNSPQLMRGTADGQWASFSTPEGRPIGLGFSLDRQSGDLYVTTNGVSALWRTQNPATTDPSAMTWQRVYDFGSDVKINLLASGASPYGTALYISKTPLQGLQRTQTLHRSLDGGQSWQQITYP